MKKSVSIIACCCLPVIGFAHEKHQHAHHHVMTKHKSTVVVNTKTKLPPSTISTVQTPSTPTLPTPPHFLGNLVNAFAGREIKTSPTWFNTISMGGVVATSFYVANHTPTTATFLRNSPAANCLALNFAEMYMNLQPVDWVRGHIAYTYGSRSPAFAYNPPGDGNVLYFREGYLTLGGTETKPAYARVGLQYLPFGGSDYTTIMDPPVRLLTLITGRPAIVAGLNNLQGWSGAVYTFNPIILKSTSDKNDTSRMHDFGASLSYQLQKDAFGLSGGADYINSMVASLYGVDTQARNSIIASGLYSTRTPGVYLHMEGNVGAFDANFKYASALQHFPLEEVPFSSAGRVFGAKPSAWGLNIGYSMDEWNSRLAIGYQGSRQAATFGAVAGATTPIPSTSPYAPSKAAIGMPMRRYYVNHTIRLYPWMSVIGEVDYDHEYGGSAGGTGRNVMIGIVQLRFRI